MRDVTTALTVWFAIERVGQLGRWILYLRTVRRFVVEHDRMPTEPECLAMVPAQPGAR